MKKKILSLLLAAVACLSMTACSSGGYKGDHFAPSAPDGISGAPAPNGDAAGDDGDLGNGGETSDSFIYGSVVEQPFVNVSESATSYFSLDRNTASYSQMRYMINNGYTIAPDAVRIEEYINYFDYNLPAPTDEAIGVSTYLSDCPWNSDNKLFMTGVTTQNVELDAKNANYVFLIDVSGSMSGDNRIGYAKKGIKLLVGSLGDGDLVSIVTYASGMEVKLDGGECGSEKDKDKIKKAVDDLRASGSTNGQGGLELAYQTAEKHFITGGNNRIVIISDGDFNVGKSTVTEMMEFIQEKAKGGVYLSVMGVGMGNMRDDMLETLARNGNGNYAYLESELEIEKAFKHDLKGNLITVAKDAKAGVTFTDNVEKYRLIGYDTKLISKDDFDDENADTGEIGSNLSVVALYEITLKSDANGEIATAEVRFKDVRGDDEVNKSVTATATTETKSSDDLSFVSCVAEFGLVLRQSKYKASASLAAVGNRLKDLASYIDGDAYKTEFVSLVDKAGKSVAYK